MKTNKAVFYAPLYVTAIMVLLSISEKLLTITAINGADDFFFTSVILQLFVYMIPAALYCKLRKLDFIEASGTKIFSASDLPFVIALFLVYAFGMLFLIYLGAVPSSSNAVNSVLQNIPASDSFFVNLCYVVIPAIVEEMLFRSVLLSEYATFKKGYALIITSLFFAMLHFSFSGFISFFWAGLVFGTITVITGSAIPSTLLHMLSNFITLTFSGVLSDFLTSAENSVVLIFLLTVFFLLSLYLAISSLQTIFEKRSAEYDMGTLRGSRRDAVKRLARAGKVEEKGLKETLKKQTNTLQDMFLSPTVLLAVFIFIFITLGLV